MILETKPIKTILLETQNPFEDIKCTDVRNSKSSLEKQVMFCRYIGIPTDENDYVIKVNALNNYLLETRMKYLKFENGLEKVFSAEEINYMKGIWEKYVEMEQSHISPLKFFQFNMGFKIKDESLEWTRKKAFREILALYDANNISSSPSMRKNFGIKLLLWMKKYLPLLIGNSRDSNSILKVIYFGDIKKYELYFLILLSKLGCDILYLNPMEDVENIFPSMNNYSNAIKYSKKKRVSIDFESVVRKKQNKRLEYTSAPPSRNTKTKEQKPMNIYQTTTNMTRGKRKEEKNYEEIAKLAESVVMIQVYDRNRELISKGSGVAISTHGFIITNFHVVANGDVFGVIFENDSNEYYSSKIIKYHTDYDLALIRVERNTTPILHCPEDSIVRGQKIVTIGSPLGLFNTISDGIISGFRSFNDVNMVQITAPISEGSSGGALLNMYGELIGITTAGYNAGQNLNIAVPMQYIRLFANNILSSND